MLTASFQYNVSFFLNLENITTFVPLSNNEFKLIIIFSIYQKQFVNLLNFIQNMNVSLVKEERDSLLTRKCESEGCGFQVSA